MSVMVIFERGVGMRAYTTDIDQQRWLRSEPCSVARRPALNRVNFDRRAPPQYVMQCNMTVQLDLR